MAPRLFVIFVALQNAEPEPAPIHAMALNQTVIVQVHRLDKIHLVALRSRPGIFPDDSFSISQVSRAMVLSDAWLSSCYSLEELENLPPTSTDSFLLVQQVRNEWTLYRCVFGIEFGDCFCVVVGQSLI